MYPYMLIATDLDGTLLDSRGRVSEENLRALDTLAKKGVHLSVATGRTYSEIPKQVLDCEAFRYFIYANGSMTLDRMNGQRISACIKNETAKKIMEIFADYEIHITARNNGNCYYDGRYPIHEWQKHFRIDPAHVRCVGEFGQPVEDIFALVSSLDEIEVFSIYFRYDDEQKECEKRLNALGNVYITSTSATNFEIFDNDAGKDKALLRLASYLGLSREQTMTLGDSENDLAMTKASGLGLVAANGSPALLSVADGVMCSNDEHVIRYVLENYFS